jgi:molybdenum cofactor cytidylyltransferase
VPGGALLLAAGASRRFGSDKRTHKLADGKALLHTTVEKYLGCFEQVVVVLRPGDGLLQEALLAGFGKRAPRVVVADDADLGMGHSLAAGIAAVADWDYAFVALADMPFIEAATLERLKQVMASAAADAIVQPTLQGRPGHPVGFGRDRFAEIAALTGDAGARSIVQRRKDQVVEVPVTDPGVLRDIDQPADLDR